MWDITITDHSYSMDRQLGQTPPNTFNHSKKELPPSPRQNSKTLLYHERNIYDRKSERILECERRQHDE